MLPIILSVAGMDWTKWNTIQNSLTVIKEHLLGETSVVTGGKDVSLLTPIHASTLYSLVHFIPQKLLSVRPPIA